MGARRNPLSERFEELPDHRLDLLADERLLAYVVASRAAGAGDAGKRALQVLVFRHLPSVRARVRAKLPEHLVDDVAHDAMVEALVSSFDGARLPQFFKWLNVIVSRHIAGFHRGRGGRQLALDREGARRARDEDGELLVRPGEGDESDLELAEVSGLIEDILAGLSASHRRVVESYVLDGDSARETAQETGESETNVYKIAQRFRDELRRQLDGDGSARETTEQEGEEDA